ncbi:multidrug efflux SMR transporter [Acetobacter sp. AN02]|uniref:DMT family transporter n=1 Tax=Acetobacter sp. AN02 TaxID=2894186 RepID=UPI0024344B94|nr:multidrug efflux SMR transporter [Acetobacter sp. AN02]MDG6094672.1 multidrug efflux SMR transporter [Acetobacter sp. AN02]
MAWIVLVISGLLEVVWAYFMKQSDGFSRPWPAFVTVATMILSFVLLAWVVRVLPLSLTYAVWTGIGVVGTAAVGVLILGEALTPVRLLALCMIIGGIILMKISSSS